MSTRIDCPDGYITFDIQEFNLTEKVASFDYDHTLVKPNHGTFSRNADDWVWLRENIPSILKNLHKEGYSIVIFTNKTKNYILYNLFLTRSPYLELTNENMIKCMPIIKYPPPRFCALGVTNCLLWVVLVSLKLVI